jgi:phospholipase C
MTNSREQGPDATGSPWQPGRPVVPGVTRRRFLQATGLGAAAAAAVGIGAGTAAAATAARPAAAKPLAADLTGTISDLKHVVILMQENRSFDHYFGTLSGVRGFGDKQALTWQNGNSIFRQPDSARTDLGYLLPYNLTDQTDGDLDHSWSGDHEAWNSGRRPAGRRTRATTRSTSAPTPRRPRSPPTRSSCRRPG